MPKLGIFYIWHYDSDHDPNWKKSLQPGADIGTSRLSSFFSVSFSYSFVSEFQTSCIVGAGIPVGYLGDYTNERAIKEWEATDANFKRQYQSYDIPIFVFANSRGAYSINYQPPIYASDRTFFEEAGKVETLIEHEIMHTYGLPDHMKPFSNSEYDMCIMGNVYLGRIQFCSECKLKLPFRGVPSYEPPVTPTPSYTYLCPTCGQTFYSADALLYHVQTAHPTTPTVPAPIYGSLPVAGSVPIWGWQKYLPWIAVGGVALIGLLSSGKDKVHTRTPEGWETTDSLLPSGKSK